MKAWLLITLFGPEREGISTAELWRQLTIRERSKCRSDDEGPLTIVRLREELAELEARGDIRAEDRDGDEFWLPAYRPSKRVEVKQAALFE